MADVVGLELAGGEFPNLRSEEERQVSHDCCFMLLVSCFLDPTLEAPRKRKEKIIKIEKK